MEGNTNIEQLVNYFEVFTNEATDAVEKFWASEAVQDTVAIATELGYTYQIQLEKQQRYIKTLGQKKFVQESVFILNIINRIEEEDKFPLLIKLLDAQCGGDISEKEYRRLIVMVDRTLYSDLLYLGHSITADPVALRTDSDYGLANSGLLVTAGSDWLTTEDLIDDTSIHFNYTLSAKNSPKFASMWIAMLHQQYRCHYNDPS